MKLASSGPHGEPVEEPDMELSTQPHYRFTRQPVKYYRHHNPGTRPPYPGRPARQPATPVRGSPGSADSSRSSSPEPGTQMHSQTLGVQAEKSHLVISASENKVEVPLSPREVVQYMLGLDSTLISSATEKSPGTTLDSPRQAAEIADRTVNLPNNRQSAGQSRTLCQLSKTLPLEHNLSSPAQKILSGLKLRRSHSGKDEQLFVWRRIFRQLDFIPHIYTGGCKLIVITHNMTECPQLQLRFLQFILLSSQIFQQHISNSHWIHSLRKNVT